MKCRYDIFISPELVCETINIPEGIQVEQIIELQIVFEVRLFLSVCCLSTHQEVVQRILTGFLHEIFADDVGNLFFFYTGSDSPMKTSDCSVLKMFHKSSA